MQTTQLSRERLNSVLRYEPESGKLYWLERPLEEVSSLRSCRSWNGKHAGREAGSACAGRYVMIKVDGTMLLAHRVISTMIDGEIRPDAVVDHINGNGLDNRLANLRVVTPKLNSRNTALRSDSTSGVAGVYWSARSGKWHASVRVNGRRKSLGYHETLEQAAAARAIAQQAHSFNQNHGLTREKRLCSGS